MKKITVTHDDGTTSTWNGDDTLTPAQVARMFGVDVKTVTRWATDGKLTSIRTLGNHRRYSAEEVAGLLAASRQVRQP